jgi:hypothetical protein
MKHVLIQGGNAVVAEVQAPMVSAKNILVLCSRFMFAPCKVHPMTATTSKAIAADVPEYARPENLPFQSGGFIRLAFFLGLMSFVRRLDEFVLSVREPVIAPLRQCRKGLEIGARGKTFGTVVDSFFRPGFGLVHKTAHLVEVESELLPLRAKPGPSGESLWAISTAPSPASSKRPPSSLDKCAMSFCFSGPTLRDPASRRPFLPGGSGGRESGKAALFAHRSTCRTPSRLSCRTSSIASLMSRRSPRGRRHATAAHIRLRRVGSHRRSRQGSSAHRCQKAHERSHFHRCCPVPHRPKTKLASCETRLNAFAED